MAINLHSKYEKKIADRFYADSFVKGNTSNSYSFDGFKSIKVPTLKKIPVTTYVRSGLQRFGAVTEVEDFVQTMTMTQEPAWSASIDKSNATDQQRIKAAGRVMKMQSMEVTTPAKDKYALNVYAQNAGQIVALSAAPTKTTIVEKIFDAGAALDNALVPQDGRVLYLKSSYYNMVRLSPEFQGVEVLAKEALTKGTVGMIADMKVVKIPDSYMPANVYFLITHKSAVLQPTKLETARVLTEVAGIDGSLLEYHEYYDAFVIGAKANGVYAAVASGQKSADPVISISSHSATITAAGSTIYYTTDGSDPRYSDTAQVYSGAITTTAGMEVSAYAVASGKFKSGVVSEIDQ